MRHKLKGDYLLAGALIIIAIACVLCIVFRVQLAQVTKDLFAAVENISLDGFLAGEVKR